ncbi:MAG: hypothetical protein ABWY52_02440 [Candidatus Limnocylindrales bacterium]
MTIPNERPLDRVGRVALAGVLIGGTILAATDPISLLFYLGYASVGVLLVIRRTSNPIGWLLLLIAFCFIGTTARPGTDVQALQAGTATIGEFLFAWTSSWVGLVSYLAFVGLAVLFPSGHLPTNRRRWPTVACLTIGSMLVAATAVAPTFTYNVDAGVTNVVILNPLAIQPGLPLWSLLPDVGLVALVFNLGLLVVAVAALVVRFRRSTGIERLQLRWLASSVVLCIGAVAFGLGTLAIFGDAARMAWIPAIVAYPTVPLAIGIAILRYRLYDIDRIISRTLSYTVVTASLAFVFVAGVLGLQAVLEPITGGNTIAVAASTLVVAALFQPVRTRVKSLVDRRFDRARFDGERTAAAFAARLRDQVDLEDLEADLDAVVRRAVAPATLGLWIYREGAGE